MDLDDGRFAGRWPCPGSPALHRAGPAPRSSPTSTRSTDVPSAAAKLADILSRQRGRLRGEARRPRRPGTTVVLGSPGTGDARKALDAAITDGTLPGFAVDDVERIAVATAAGVAFIDPARTSVITTVAMDGGAHGLALVPGVDDPEAVRHQRRPDDPGYDVIAVGGDAAKDGPVAPEQASAAGSRVAG